MEEIRERIEVALASGNTAVATMCVPRLDGFWEARGHIAETGEAFYVVLPEGAKYGNKASLTAIRKQCDEQEARQKEASAEAATITDVLQRLTFDLVDSTGKPIVGSVLVRDKETGTILTCVVSGQSVDDGIGTVEVQ